MALLDLLGRGWALRVLWELRDGPALTFRGLQSRCGDISSSVLNDRPRELRGAGIVTAARGDGYRLSSEGRRLLQALAPLSTWARRGSEDEAQRVGHESDREHGCAGQFARCRELAAADGEQEDSSA